RGKTLLWVLPLLGLALAGCVEDDAGCTEIGCSPGLLIGLDRPLEQPGRYTVVVLADGQAMSCTTRLCRSSAPDGCDASLSTSATGAMSRHGRSEAAPRNLAEVGINGQYESVAVSIELDGDLLAEAAFSPEYRDVELNGPGCGTCPTAQETLP